MIPMEQKIEVLQRITGDVFNDSELIDLINKCKNQQKENIFAFVSTLAYTTNFTEFGATMIWGAVLALIYLDDEE